MNIYIWILLGLIAGFLVSVLMGTYSVKDILTDVVLGTVGAIAGGLILSILDQPRYSGFNFYQIIIAILGAIALVWLGKLINTSADKTRG